MKFNEKDLLQIEEKGLTIEEVERQLEIFKRGNIKVNILEAATVGRGIFRYSETKKKDLIALFEKRKKELDLLKFVPASGAATRMFKALHNFVDEFDPQKESLREYLDKKNDPSLLKFFTDMPRLPFYEMALDYAKENNKNFDKLPADEQELELVNSMLYKDGLHLSIEPKGLVPFHKYKDHLATAFEEHLYGASRYLEVKGHTKLHFTVSEGDKEKFEEEFQKIREALEERTGTKYDISYSYQDPKTDTIAVNDHNEAFRTDDGRLFFRPGGHGALVDNLNNLDADLIFIKNVDNVIVKDAIGDVVEYKKMLGGKLLELQDRLFNYLKELDAKADNAILEEMHNFLSEELFARIHDFEKLSTSEKIASLREKFNRPIRVCGMVKNEGEPGGGPFLVKGKDGEISLQIIEGAQIDKKNPEQLKAAREATHFNPVDIVCGIRDYKGKHFILEDFVDPEMSFIANKTKDGKPLKALERPGLWNGGMAKWNTLFVEVPVTTFNPVKTVADLLKPTHQVSS